MIHNISTEDLRRALGLEPSMTLTSIAVADGRLIMDFQEGRLIELANVRAYVTSINKAIEGNKEIKLKYKQSATPRTFLPQKWINAFTVEGLDLDKDDIRRFDISHITWLLGPT